MTTLIVSWRPRARFSRHALLGALLVTSAAFADTVSVNTGVEIRRDNMDELDLCVSASSKHAFTFLTIVHPSHLTIDGEQLAYVNTTLTFLAIPPSRSFTTSFDSDTQDGYGEVGLLLMKEQIGKVSLIFDYGGNYLSFEDLFFVDGDRYTDQIQRPCDQDANPGRFQ